MFNGVMISKRHKALRPLLILLGLIALWFVAPTAWSQNAPDIEPPDGLSVSSLEALRERTQARTDLSDDKQTNTFAAYERAILSMETASNDLADGKRYGEVLKNSGKLLEALQMQIETAKNLPPITLEDEMSEMNSQNLAELQQSLISKKAELRAMRSRITALSTELESLQTRRLAAPDEQAEAQSQINTLTARLAEMSPPGSDVEAAAQRAALRSRLYARHAQAFKLEQEITSFAERQKLISASRDLTQLQTSRTASEVEALQRLTGQQRVIDARLFSEKAEAAKAELTTTSPLVLEYADENIRLAKDLGARAAAASTLPRQQAQLRSAVDIVEADLITATSLIELGNLSRTSARTLRKLRNDNQQGESIRAQIRQTRLKIATTTQTRLLAQDQLRNYALGKAGTDVIAKEWLADNPAAATPGPADITALDAVLSQHREILSEIVNASSEQFEELSSLQSVQENLLERTETLTSHLDQNLLWLPSVPVIDRYWPGKVVRGAIELFSPKNFGLLGKTLAGSLRGNSFVTLLFIIVIGALYSIRSHLWDDIKRRAALVGRVQKDSYWHTPAVLLACILIALPLALIFALLAILLLASGSPEPLISQLGEGFAYLANFTLFFLSWRAWDRDLSLFDAHFNLHKDIRHAVNSELRWFIPLVGASTFLIVITQDSASPTIHDGLSLFVFLVTCSALALFFYSVLWKRRKHKRPSFAEDTGFNNYRTILAGTLTALPILAGIFASCGYYETTSELLYRCFISGWLFIGTYVVYGITRRFIMVSKRRIALQQAIERRDKAVRARAEQAAAEERGEEPVAPPPAVDYDQIDVESLSRQTLKLINAIMVVGFAVLTWMIWSDLMPALTFFNNIELGSYMATDAEGLAVLTPITLWNLMQAFFIGIMTALAARNLPGFLEIFVLSRMGVDPGSRYAIVTILGYIIIGIGVFMALDRLGLQWSQLKWVITGLSVGIGLGLQKIIANFVSGLIILFERPVRIGDYVTIGDQSGNVSRIQIRATTLTDLDNREILIPNEALISERVTNWTLSNSTTRLIIPVGIAYGSDTDKAQQIMLDVLKSNPNVMETPQPKVLFTGFGDSALDFQLRIFLKNFEERWPTTHTIHNEVNKALTKAGISIPFPQRDLHIVSGTESLPAKIKGPSKPTQTPPRSKLQKS